MLGKGVQLKTIALLVVSKVFEKLANNRNDFFFLISSLVLLIELLGLLTGLKLPEL